MGAAVSARGPSGIEWHWVKGHVGTSGNERCDEIAVAFALQRDAGLYDGPLIGYPRPILDLPDDTSLPKRSSSGTVGKQKQAAHAYLSVVDGVPMRHATWAECERRV